MDVVNAALCLTGNDAPGPHEAGLRLSRGTLFFAGVFHACERVAESIIGFSSQNVTRSMFTRDEIVLVRSRFPPNARKSLPAVTRNSKLFTERSFITASITHTDLDPSRSISHSMLNVLNHGFLSFTNIYITFSYTEIDMCVNETRMVKI